MNKILMKNEYKLLKSLIFFTLLFLFSCQNCKMTNHNFYLIPLKREDNNNNNETSIGLNKYNYNLILNTDPLSESDNYHMVFLISFPININIELDPEIIYIFESRRKFCLTDLIQNSTGKQNNIEGSLCENAELCIFNNIWIKIEKLLMYKSVDLDEKKNKFFLLTELTDEDSFDKQYLLMKKMHNSEDKQFFQIIRVNIHEKGKNKDCLDNRVTLEIGTEFTIQEINIGDDFMLREGFDYETFASDTNLYNFTNTHNLVCFLYENKQYGNKCFSNN